MMAPIERPANETIQQQQCQDPTNWNDTIPRMKCRDSAFGTRVQLIRQFLRSKGDDGSRPPPRLLGTYARFHALIEPKIFPQLLSFPLKHPLDLDSRPDQRCQLPPRFSIHCIPTTRFGFEAALTPTLYPTRETWELTKGADVLRPA